MTINKQEVKTIYNICITHSDFIRVFEWYKDNETEQMLYPKAFDFDVNNEDIKYVDIHTFYVAMQFRGTGDTAKVISDFFGFDGWENSGYYDKQKEVFKMVVYNEGSKFLV